MARARSGVVEPAEARVLGDDKWNALYVDPYTDKPDIVPEPIIPYDVVQDAVVRADAELANVHRLPPALARQSAHRAN